MEKITKLEELCPKTGYFILKSTGNTYQVQPISSLVECQFEEKFGAHPNTVIKNGNADAIYWLVYTLIRDKSDFKASEETVIDDAGEEHQMRIGGYKKFQMLCTGGPSEQAAIVDALMMAQHGHTASEIIEAAQKLEDEKTNPKKKRKAS